MIMDQLVCIEKSKPFFVDVVNSSENWGIIGATGITWLADEQTDSHIRVTAYSQEDIQEIKNMLESLSSDPYPNLS
jgi:hypothetical protein